MKLIAILAAFIVAFVGSGCAASSTEEQHHGRKLGKKSGKKAEGPKYYTSLLNPAQEAPLCAGANPAMGNAVITYYEMSLCVKLTYSGLTGSELASHIHGPAMVGESTSVLFPFVTTDAIKAECFTLSSLQKDYLDGGLLYLNVHTAACPGGEIRGQIFPVY
jgi:hypothetical protein